MKICKNVESLLSYLDDRNVIIVEGASCAGKDVVISKIMNYKKYAYYECLHPRKSHLDIIGNMNSSNGDYLSIKQACIWSLDLIRQQPNIPFIVNRSMLSSHFYDGPNDKLFEIWVKLLVDMNGLVVLVNPSDSLHRNRVITAKRGSQWNSIEVEKKAIMHQAMRVPSNNLVIIAETQENLDRIGLDDDARSS